MRRLLLAVVLGISGLAGCNATKSESEEFKSNLEKAAEAAEKGKELVKSPARGKR